MSDPTSFSSLEDQIRVVVAVPQARVEFVDQLQTELLKHATKKYTAIERPIYLRPVWVACLCVVGVMILMTLIIGPQKVYATVLRLFGYIPGVGIVNQSAPIRVLGEPVTMTRDGITLTVSEAILSADKTQVVVNIKGVPQDAYPRNEGDAGCLGAAKLRLPDGTLLDGAYIRGGNWSFFQTRLEFGPVPASMNEATLIVDCIGGTIPGRLPQDWEVSLLFVPASPEMTVNPVIEISPSPELTNQTGIPALSQPLLTLDRYVELDNGYLLIGAFHNINLPNGLTFTGGDQTGILKFTDAKGQAVVPEPVYDVQFPGYSAGNSPWAYKIHGKQFAWPLTITLPDAMVRLPEQEIKFAFDAGPDPQTGQEWVLNRDVDMNGYHARLISIRRLVDGYTFILQFGPQVVSVGAWFEGYTAVGGGGGPDNHGYQEQDETYANTPPAGKLTVVLSIQEVLIPGPWSVNWQPDVLPTAAPSPQTTPNSICVTADNQPQLSPAPASMDGKALLYQKLEESGTWGIVLADLNGNHRQVIATLGNWPALSPDGTQVVYSYDVLYMADLPSGQVRALPGTNGNDYNPLWSPDGKWIAFINSVNGMHISLIAPDGTHLRRVFDDSNHGALAGWSPDGTKLYFTAPGLEGQTLYAIDVVTGEVKTLFVLEDASLKAPNATVSPDGTWIAYRDRIMNVYLVRMDGTNRHLVASGSYGVSTIVWSGDWLGIGLGNYNAEDTLVLLQPQTCLAFILPALHGNLEGMRLP
jgi:hypothetical protein